MRNYIIGVVVLGVFALIGLVWESRQGEGEVVNVYSYRQPGLIEPILAKFTEKTGIRARVIFASKGLVERVRLEGASSPADVILTTDIGVLAEAAGVAQAVESQVLRERVPQAWRDSEGKWFGLTLRARVAFASKERVQVRELDYVDLAGREWRGRLCLRSGQHPYNVALFAAMLEHLGEQDFKHWLEGVRDNLAQKPSGNDRAQVRNIYGGVCDLAIGNTYYMGKMLANDEQQVWARSVRLVFAQMPRGGAHVNISGMALAEHSPNRDNALKLMEYLVSDEAQELYASRNFEYPIVRGVAASPLVASWGALVPDGLSMERIADKRKRASQIVDELGFNN